jgi:hypothetical protein
MAFKCPNCARPLYNRRRATCEFCAAAIPPGLLLTSGQQARVDAMKRDEQSRHREAMSRDLPGGGSLSGGGDLIIGDLGG